MSGKDEKDVRSQQNPQIDIERLMEDFARLMPELAELPQPLTPEAMGRKFTEMILRIGGFEKLARVAANFLRQLGKREMDPDDAATRLQVAMEGRTPDATAPGGRKGRSTRIPEFPPRDPREMAMRIGEYEEHLRSHPNDRRALLMLSQLYERVGRRADAIVRYRELAGWYVGEEKHLKAVAVLKHALELNAEDITTRQNLAYILAEKLGLLPDAVREYQQCAIRSKQAGDTDGYLAVLHDAFRWDTTNNPDIRRTLLQAYADAGRAEEGLRIVKDGAAQEQRCADGDANHRPARRLDGRPRLHVMSGQDEGRYLKIADDGQEYEIGSGKVCDLALRGDPFVGERHAIMRRISAGVVMVACEGHRVTIGDRILGGDGDAVMLHDKDEIRIGATTLVYRDPDAESITGLDDLLHDDEERAPSGAK